MGFGENFKKIRLKKGISQEMIAEKLHVTILNISDWENEITSPEIRHIPTIANIFGMTTDELLGCSADKEEEEVLAILDKVEEYDAKGNVKEMCKCIEEGIAKYPGNFKLLAEYVYVYQSVDADKAIKVGNEVLDRCTDDRIRGDVRTNLIYAYKKKNDYSKVRELANSLPGYVNSRQDILVECLFGKEQSEVAQKAVMDIADEFWYIIRQIKVNFDTDGRLELFNRSNAIYDAIYEKDTMPSALYRKMRNFQTMAEICLLSGRVEEGYKYMEYAASCAAVHDEIPDVSRPNLLLYSMEFNKEKDDPEGNEKIKKILLEDFETQNVYASYRGSSQYKAIVAALR